jgi:hypothetical protein
MVKLINGLFNTLCPSFVSNHDPATVGADSEHANLQPIGIKKLSLMPHVRRELNRQRQVPVRPARTDGKKLTLIVPFRDRWEHLGVFEKETIPYIAGQGIDCEVLVIEQEFGKPFNRAMLLNIGVKESRPESEYFCLHDVDFVPIRADYRYCSHPLRIISHVVFDSARCVSSREREFEDHYFSGVVLISREYFTAINGFSNEYWQYSHEDDDIFLRLLYSGFMPLCDRGGKFRGLYHEPSVYKNEAGVYLEPQRKEERKRLMELKRRNSRIYRKFRRKLIGCESGFDNVRYRVLGSEQRDGYRIITVSI